ncbi:MAG TPA: redoxin domain-containing protein [Planctomycetes bacterium]|nr:redoxin domain-containing protein [Planctomycetota bacterium]
MSKTGLSVILVPAVLIIAFSGCKEQPSSSRAAEPVANAPDKPASAQQAVAQAARKLDFTLTDHNGKEVKLSDYSGKIVVLEWFNYDCPFVKPHYEDATFANLADKYAGKDVVWLAVNSTNYATSETNKQWAQNYELSYPILDDSSGKVGRLFGATNTPHIFIIDRAGRIAYEGAIDNAPLGKVKGEYINYVDKALAELTAGKSVSLAATRPYGCTVKYAN